MIKMGNKEMALKSSDTIEVILNTQQTEGFLLTGGGDLDLERLGGII